jgi:hypothetical protein
VTTGAKAGRQRAGRKSRREVNSYDLLTTHLSPWRTSESELHRLFMSAQGLLFMISMLREARCGKALAVRFREKLITGVSQEVICRNVSIITQIQGRSAVHLENLK